MKYSFPFSEKISKLVPLLSNKKVIVAFSGGMDSTLLLLLAVKYAQKVTPVFFYGPLFTKEELDRALEFCKILKIQLEIMDYNPLTEDDFRKNPKNRCYYCKKYIMSALLQVQQEIAYDIIIEGTNTSDLTGPRPGYQALQEMGIVSPFILANINKTDIVDLLKYISVNPEWFIDSNFTISPLDLSQFLKNIIKLPSNACLCSRVDYGIEITEDLLRGIHKAELFLRELFSIRTLRVRIHKRNLVRIEIPQYQIFNILTPDTIRKIVDTFKNLGFSYVTLDLEGFRSGSFD